MWPHLKLVYNGDVEDPAHCFFLWFSNLMFILVPVLPLSFSGSNELRKKHTHPFTSAPFGSLVSIVILLKVSPFL